ncbi:FAD/NAD(P)-binding domain-containing protein [Lophiostoma macrostomum CBS 122681]|uniref:FAD/NAD(P)-binding domain-containing protein n=1 Tax=Lophiostoma macrostomum CBS 122681 TaxID=1314788 RepID=A0A6A6TFW8_9PLEO|nr:FAD/NAD(P)-binding domain-containing protein [Lophiostoma macrostomum CBS 122681]
MKIIIIGAGISGLSTYLHLRKHLSASHTITLHESHRPRSTLPTTSSSSSTNPTLTLDTLSASTALVGGGLGISPNGMRVLRDLDVALHDAVAAQGFPAERFVFKGANGWALGKQWTGDGKVRGEGEVEEVCISSARHGLWEMLMKRVVEEGGVVRYAKVVGAERDEERGQTVVRVEDGEGGEEVDRADLVIGADGVRSVVRKALFGEEEKEYQPKYTGQSGVGGFLKTPIPTPLTEDKSMVFTFGGNGFFGYASSAPASEESLMWWSTFETDALPATKNIDITEIKQQLVQRHKHWKDPIIQDIIKRAEVQSIYPTWTIGELPYWGENGIVLIGDAAHAMDPTTGQGASQALEDSQTLALLLAECLKRGEQGQLDGKQAIALTLKLFYQIRNPRVQEIVERGKKISGSKTNVGVVMEYTMYLFLWLLIKFPSIGLMMLGDVNRKLYTWSAEEEIRKALHKWDTAT